MTEFQSDFYRYYKRKPTIKDVFRVFKNRYLLYLYFFRKAQKGKFFSKLIKKHLDKKYLLEIPSDLKVGKGFYLGHASGITINPNVIIVDNCNIHKGVTLGKENRGKRKGTPIISNKVWIGINSTIVGKVNIGDDVLIAPNSYVNCDVPSHSVVIGNPCKIITKENATEDYIDNEV